MEQSPSCEASSHSASQEIPRLLCNPKVHYRVHKNPPLLLVLSQMHPVRAFKTYFPKTFPISSFRLLLGLPSDLFPSDFQTKTAYTLRYTE
jgi:hypothetical protein